MNESLSANVLDRLTNLERENRQLKRTGAAALAILLALVLTGQVAPPAPPGTVEAKHFVLRDGNGRRRADLTTVDVEDGSPYLVLRDKEDRVRMALAVLRDGQPSVSFRDQAGQARASIGLGFDGAPGLEFWSKEGVRRAALNDAPKTGVGLSLYHDNTSRATLRLYPDGSTSLMLDDPQVMLSDKSGKVTWRAP
jgi:hypothetical protein